jgi:hypothetical protein
MAKQRIDPAIARAHTMMEWLATFDLPTRASNALRRDLEVTLGIRVGKAGSGTLAAMDQAQFVEELYSANGGKIRNIPGVADTAISALRAVIPPPAGTPDPTADDFTLPPLDDDEPMPAAQKFVPPARDQHKPASHRLDDDAALHPAVHFGADPEEEDHAAELAELAELDAASHVAAAPNRRVPRRRGRPRRTPPPVAPPPEPTIGATSPAFAMVTPEPLRLAASRSLPPGTTVAMTEEARLLHLWSGLHPQGRRATLSFIATLVAEEA